MSAIGVTFQSPRTGDKLRFTPTGTIDWQRQLGSDFVMQLDECAPYPCDFSHAQRAMQRSLKWAKIGQSVPLQPHQIFLPIVQGSTFPDLRDESAKALADLDARAYAIGGLSVSVGEGQALMLEILDRVTPLLPADLLACIARSIDMFAGCAESIDARPDDSWSCSGAI